VRHGSAEISDAEGPVGRRWTTLSGYLIFVV
jgi:hypothetical protein